MPPPTEAREGCAEWPCGRGLCTPGRRRSRRPTTTLPSTVTTMFVVSAAPSMLECTFYAFGSARILELLTAALSGSAAVKNSTSAEGVDGTFQHAQVSRRDKPLPFRLRRRGSRARPARHGASPGAERLAGPSRPTLGPSALAGRRLATATAGLRKASELFKLSCTYYGLYSCNEPDTRDCD